MDRDNNKMAIVVWKFSSSFVPKQVSVVSQSVYLTYIDFHDVFFFYSELLERFSNTTEEVSVALESLPKSLGTQSLNASLFPSRHLD